MKYHSLEFDDIDGYVSLGLGKYKKINDKLWRVGPGCSTNRFDENLTLEAKKIKQQYAQFELVTASIGREEKLADPVFLETIGRILKVNPKIAFLWTGRVQLPQIQNKLDEMGISSQCFFIGWVNTKLYAQVIDLFLDSFPFPCGVTLTQAMIASKACVLYYSPESCETGVVGNIMPILDFPHINKQEYDLFCDIFHLNQNQKEKLYFCAKSHVEYEEYANLLIRDKNLRNDSAKANRKFVELLLTDLTKMAEVFSHHFLETISLSKLPNE